MDRSNRKAGENSISRNDLNKQAPKKKWATMNRRYHYRFIIRSELLILAVCIYFLDRQQYDLLFRHFFQNFTLLHVIWFLLLGEMLLQAIPLPWMPTGCMKQFAFRYEPVPDEAEPNGKAASLRAELLRSYRKSQDLRALIVLIVWFVLNSFWWVLFLTGRFTEAECFVGSVLYAVFDLICILWFCPFQLFLMDTKCCSTCRIFNYGQIFTVTPMLFIPSFASLSLVAVAVFIFLQWEIKWHLHPERFYEGTNLRLNCAHCTEQFCVSRNKFYLSLHIPLPGRKASDRAQKKQ